MQELSNVIEGLSTEDSGEVLQMFKVGQVEYENCYTEFGPCHTVLFFLINESISCAVYSFRENATIIPCYCL